MNDTRPDGRRERLRAWCVRVWEALKTKDDADKAVWLLAAVSTVASLAPLAVWLSGEATSHPARVGLVLGLIAAVALVTLAVHRLILWVYAHTIRTRIVLLAKEIVAVKSDLLEEIQRLRGEFSYLHRELAQIHGRNTTLANHHRGLKRELTRATQAHLEKNNKLRSQERLFESTLAFLTSLANLGHDPQQEAKKLVKSQLRACHEALGLNVGRGACLFVPDDNDPPMWLTCYEEDGSHATTQRFFIGRDDVLRKEQGGVAGAAYLSGVSIMAHVVIQNNLYIWSHKDYLPRQEMTSLPGGYHSFMAVPLLHIREVETEHGTMEQENVVGVLCVNSANADSFEGGTPSSRQVIEEVMLRSHLIKYAYMIVRNQE